MKKSIEKFERKEGEMFEKKEKEPKIENDLETNLLDIGEKIYKEIENKKPEQYNDTKPFILKVRRFDHEKQRFIGEEVEDLDPKIRDLVIGLRRAGLETSTSCEGHPEKKGHPSYPQINIDLDPNESHSKYSRFLIDDILKIWNGIELKMKGEKKIAWGLEKSGVIKELRPENINLPLVELQGGARKFGFWLQSLPDEFLRKIREKVIKETHEAEEAEEKAIEEAYKAEEAKKKS